MYISEQYVIFILNMFSYITYKLKYKKVLICILICSRSYNRLVKQNKICLKIFKTKTFYSNPSSSFVAETH
jgi:hypothetical protein